MPKISRLPVTNMNKMVSPAGLEPVDGPLYAPRKKVYPQRVSGTFRRIKWALMAVCLAIYYFLPFVRWNRGPTGPSQAVLIDFPSRRSLTEEPKFNR